jgi:uncharacterized protein involved in exopolysaccharide biosynthesis
VATEEDSEAGEQEGSGGGGIDPRIIRSYLSFAKRAIKTRRLTIAIIAFVGIALTGVVAKFIPRTYHCATVLMTVENAVLDGDRGAKPLAGAKNLIMRHENLEQLVKQTGLIKKFSERRPPLLRFKDELIQSLTGKLDDKTMTAVLVGTLETKIAVDTTDSNLAIDVDWNDRYTAAELAQAVQDNFLKIRHKAEISAFQEKMAILDNHAGKMRQEIETLASQLDAAANEAANLNKPSGGSTAPRPAAATGGGARAPRSTKPVTDAQLPELRERLGGMKQKLMAVEAERAGRMGSENAKLDELKLKFTPSHPQVITQEERLAMASQVSSELALLRSEVADLESQIKQRDAMVKTGPASAGGAGGGGAARAAGAEAEPLSADVTMLLARDEGDPALKAQLSGAVIRYGSLRDDVRAAKIALDTAQAAFNHRYQVMIPVEVPNKPSKPSLAVVIGAGIFLSLLLALIIPILSELRRGVLVEYWQVDAFHLPVLADLHLPPATKE